MRKRLVNDFAELMIALRLTARDRHWLLSPKAGNYPSFETCTDGLCIRARTVLAKYELPKEEANDEIKA